MICFIVLCSEFKRLLFDVKLSPIQGKQLSFVSPFKSPSNSIGRLIGEVWKSDLFWVRDRSKIELLSQSDKFDLCHRYVYALLSKSFSKSWMMKGRRWRGVMEVKKRWRWNMAEWEFL